MCYVDHGNEAVTANNKSDNGEAPMNDDMKKNGRIRIIPHGPYLVTGSVKLSERIIVHRGNRHIYIDGRELPQKASYTLCRCGKSKNMPFCDNAHQAARFDGTETAPRNRYLDRARRIEGPGVNMTDDEPLCALVRFCHQPHGDVWSSIECSDRQPYKDEVIQGARECSSGRLTAWDKTTGQPEEPEYEPEIAIVEDRTLDCSGPLFVMGGITLESAAGDTYEVRNRMTLCRCGASRNKPFCDASHVMTGFDDQSPSLKK
jgi:CDGSH-type Zn-finger protein